MATIANDSECPPIDCTGFAHAHLKPYPGMTGNGNLTLFVGSAYFVLFLVVASYFLAFDPNEDPLEDPDDASSTSSWHPNTIDQRFITWARRTSNITTGTRVRLQSAFDESILSLCDHYLMNGPATLCHAYSLLICGFDAGHWQVVAYLAWFPAVIHLSGLSVLRTSRNVKPWTKHTRIFFTSAHLILLTVALIPTGIFTIESDVASQAICYFNSNYGYWRYEAQRSERDPLRVEDTQDWQAMLLSITLLISGFMAFFVKLLQPLSTFLRRGIRQPLSHSSQRGLRRMWPSGAPSGRSETLRLNLVTKPASALFFMARLSCDLLSSRIFEIYWLLIILLWGTVKLVRARNALISQSDDIATAENQWGFDCKLPFFLLLSFNLFLDTFNKFTNKVGLFEMIAIFRSTRRTQKSSPKTPIPLQDQDHLSSEATGPTGTPNPGQDDESLQNNSPSTPATPESTVSIPDEGDLPYLDDYSDAPWLPICAAIPFLSILPASVFLFLSASNPDTSFESPLSFYEIWVSKSNVLHFLFISYPCACATTIRLGLGMELGNIWKRIGFFLLCFLIYTLHCFPAVGSILFPVEGPMQEWFNVAPYTGLGPILPLYVSYIIYWLVMA